MQKLKPRAPVEPRALGHAPAPCMEPAEAVSEEGRHASRLWHLCHSHSALRLQQERGWRVPGREGWALGVGIWAGGGGGHCVRKWGDGDTISEPSPRMSKLSVEKNLDFEIFFPPMCMGANM